MAARKREHMEDDDISQFYQLQKSQVLHEAKAFNDTPLDNRKCCSVLTELLCLLSQGEVLGKEEATTLFFGVTKLFQSQDVRHPTTSRHITLRTHMSRPLSPNSAAWCTW